MIGRKKQGGWVAHRGGGVAAVPMSLVISANQTALYNARTAIGSPSYPVALTITVNAGVVLQAYRAIGDRHLFEPNFRTLSAETYRGFASADPALSLESVPIARAP